jgi:tetratricopeptide (TPR) repeat protein
MAANKEGFHPSEVYASGFSRIFWAMPFLAVTAGPMISIGKEQIIIDLLPDWLGFALIASGAGRLMALHPRARTVRNLALMLNFLAIPLWVQYRRITGQAGNLVTWEVPLWPLVSLVGVLGGVMLWKLCDIVANIAEWAGDERTRHRALSRRGLGLIMAILAGGLLSMLHFAPQWLVPAALAYVFVGLWVTWLMMRLMSQARRICLAYEFTDFAEADADGFAKRKLPGWASRMVALAGMLLPLCLVPLALWYYYDWQTAWEETRSAKVKRPEHEQLALHFLNYIQGNQLDDAYELTTPNFKQRMSRADFKALIRRFDGLKEGPQPGFSMVGLTGDWEPGYRGYEDADGKHIKYTLFVRRPDPSILQRRPPPAGVDEFSVEELDTPESRRSQRQVRRTRLWNRGIELWNDTRWDKAEVSCRQSLELSKEIAQEQVQDYDQRAFVGQCHLYLGKYLARAGKHAKADEEFRLACEVYAQVADDFLAVRPVYQYEQWGCQAEWAACLARAGKAQEADKHFHLAAQGLEKWTKDFPEQARPNLNWRLLWRTIDEGNQLARAAKFKEADREFQFVRMVLDRMVRICPSLQPAFQYQVGLIHFDRCYACLLAGRMAEARAEFDKAKALWKQHNQANHKGSPESVAQAQRAVQQDPQQASVWHALGVAHYRNGHFPSAIEAFEKARTLQSDWVDNSFYLAMSHWQLGRKVEARQWFDKGVISMEKQTTNDFVTRYNRVEATFLLGLPEGR